MVDHDDYYLNRQGEKVRFLRKKEVFVVKRTKRAFN